MSFTKWDQHVIRAPVLSDRESAADRRATVAKHDAEELDRRQAELVQLRAATASVSERIRLWETRYGLAMPRDPGHPLLACIAQVTHLSLVELRREQQVRQNAA